MEQQQDGRNRHQARQQDEHRLLAGMRQQRSESGCEDERKHAGHHQLDHLEQVPLQITEIMKQCSGVSGAASMARASARCSASPAT